VSTGNRIHSPRPPLNLQPFIDGCLATHKTLNLSARSLRELACHLQSLRQFAKQARLQSINDLTPRLLHAFLDTHAFRGKTHLKLLVWALRTFGAWLAAMQYLGDSPAKSLSHPVLRRREKLPLYLRPQEFTAFLDTAVQQFDLRDCSVIMLMCNAGLRPREITLLQPQHVNPLRKVIALTVKGGSLRLLPIAGVLAEVLQEYLQEYGVQRGDPLFLNEWDRPIDVRWIERLVRRVATRAGIPRRITPNMLRHTFATYMADRHGKIITRAYLGHGAGASTDVYMHLVPSKYRQYMNAHPFQTQPRSSEDLPDEE